MNVNDKQVAADELAKTNIGRPDYGLKKEERLWGKKITETLFDGGSHSMVAFPLRLVYKVIDHGTAQPLVQARVMVSVSKRRFKRAVKRNRVKRQVREAYRHRKALLSEKLSAEPQREVIMAFIWLDDKLHSSAEVSKSVDNLMTRLSEKI